MKKSLKQTLLVLIAIAMLVVAGCDDSGPMETAGEEIDEAAEEAGEQIEEAGEDIQEEAEEGKDVVDDAINQ